MQHTCLIFADVIATNEVFQHATGDYHRACFGSIAAAALKAKQWSGAGARCHLCNHAIAPRAVIVMPGRFIVHLRCFFGSPSAGRKSRGAAASTATLVERSIGLCRESRVLHVLGHRLRARAKMLRARHRTIQPI